MVAAGAASSAGGASWAIAAGVIVSMAAAPRVNANVLFTIQSPCCDRLSEVTPQTEGYSYPSTVDPCLNRDARDQPATSRLLAPVEATSPNASHPGLCS